MVHRVILSLRYRGKRVLLYAAAFTVLFSLCFGSIVLFFSVKGQQIFLQGALERSVTLRSVSYSMRINETQGSGLVTSSLNREAIEMVRQDPAVEDWNACLRGGTRIIDTTLPYAEEREQSWEEHRNGQTGVAGRDGMASLFVRDSRRSLAFLLCGLDLVEGTHFAGDSPGNVCLVSEMFAELNGLSVGDRITATNPSETLVEGQPYEVEVTIEGIFSSPDSERLKGIGARAEEMVIFPLSLYESMTGNVPEDYFQYLSVYLREGSRVQDFVTRIQTVLPIVEVWESHYTQGVALVPPEEFAGMDFYDLPSFLEENQSYILQLDKEWYDMVAEPVNQQVKLTGAMMVLLLASVALILILTTVLSLRERQREIGILLSMGEARVKVMGQLLLETLVPVLIALVLGSLVGISAGVPLVEGLSNVVYAEQAAEAQKDNQAVTFGNLLSTTDSYEIQEGKLSMDLADGGITDVTTYPPAETVVNGPAVIAYAGVILLFTVGTALCQGVSVMRAQPAKILLGRK